MNFYESCALWFSPKEECESDGVTSAPTNVSIATSIESIEQLEKCGVSKNEIDINHTDGVIIKRQQSICKDNANNITNIINNEKCNIDDGKNSSSDTIDSHGVGLTDSGGCTPLELFHTAPETRPLMTPLLECVPTSSEITNKESVKTNNSDSVITITKKNNILRNNDSPRNDMNVNDDKHDHCINLKEIKEYSSNAEVISVYESDTETECKTENRYEHNDFNDKEHNKYVNDTINARKSMLLIQYHATHKMIKECSVEDVSEQILSIETQKEEKNQIAEVKEAHQVPESTCVSSSSKVQVKEKYQQQEEEEEEEANKIGKVSKKLTQSPLCPRPLDYDSPSSEQGSPTNKELSVHSPSFASTTTLTNDKEKAVNTNNKKFCTNNCHNDDQEKEKEEEKEGIVASTTANITSNSVHNEVNIKSISSPLLPPCSIDAEDEYDENHDDNSSVYEHVFDRVQDTWHTINCNQAHAESSNHYKSVYGNNTTSNSTNYKSHENKTKEVIKPGCNYDAPPFIPNNLLTNNLRRLPSLEQEDSVIIAGNKGQARSISIHNNNNNNKRNLANTKTLNEGNNKNNLIRERNRSYYSRGEGNDDEDDDNDNDNDYNYENKFYNKSFKNYNNSGKLYNSKTNKTTSSFTVNNNNNNNTSFSSFTRKRAAATSPSSTSSLSALLTPNETMRYWMNESNNRVASYNKLRRHTDQHTMKMLKETNMGNEMVFQAGIGGATNTSSPLPLSSASMPLTRSADAHVDCYSEFSSFPGYYQDVSATRYANCANKGANSFTRRSRAPIQQSHSLYNKKGRSRYNLASSAERTNQVESNDQNYEDDEGAEVNDDDDEEEGEQEGEEEDVIGLMDQYSMEWPYLYYMNMMNYAQAVMGTYDAYNGVWIPADDIANEYIANMEGVNENIDGNATVNDHDVVDINVDMNELKEENRDNKKDEEEKKDASAPCQVSEQHTSCSLSELKDINTNVSHSSFAKQKDTSNEGNSKLDNEKSNTTLSTTTHNDSSHVSSTKIEIDETKTQHNSHWSETTPPASTELIPPEPLEPYEMEEDNINMHTTNTTYSSLQESNSTNINIININNNNNTIKTNNNYNNNNNIQFANNSNISSCNYNGHVDQRFAMPSTEASNMIKPSAVQLNPASVFNNYMYNNNNYKQNLNNGGGVLQQPAQLLTPFNGQYYSAGATMNNGGCGSCSNINSTFVNPPSVHLPSMQTSTSTEINVGELASIQFVPYAPQPIDATEYQIRNLSLPTYLSSSCNSVNSSFVSGSGRQTSSQRWHRHDPYNLTSVLPDNSYNTSPANSRQCSASVSTPHLRIESPRLTRKIPSNVTFKFHDPIKRMSSLRLQKQEETITTIIINTG